MIIEFIGAPGAGKTTLMPSVIGFFQERGIDTFTVVEAARPFAQRTVIGKVIKALTPPSLRRPLLWQLFYRFSVLRRRQFRQKYPQLMEFLWASQANRPAAADVQQRKVLYWFDHLTGYYTFLQAFARPNEALVLDEGFVHRVVQLFSSSVEQPDREEIATYLDLVPQPDLVIFAQAPRDVCEQRIYTRGLWERARQKDAAEISQFVANAHLAVNLAAEHMRQKGWAMIAVDNGRDDLPAVQAELRHQLDKVTWFPGETVALQTA
jgi:thymidylate kinase